MQKKALLKYMVCVLLLAGTAIVCGLVFNRSITREIAMFCYALPLMFYLTLARTFHAGNPFNVILFSTVFTAYFGVMLLPMYFAFASRKWSYVFIQAVVAGMHFLVGALIVIQRFF
jgi:hypothetical protein